GRPRGSPLHVLQVASVQGARKRLHPAQLRLSDGIPRCILLIGQWQVRQSPNLNVVGGDGRLPTRRSSRTTSPAPCLFSFPVRGEEARSAAGSSSWQRKSPAI